MSNNNDFTINDFENICRTCLCRGDLKPLYEKCSQSTCLVDMLMTCTFVKFAEDDGLPVKICTNCIREIDQAFSFVKRCETTDTILRECVNKFQTDLANNSTQSQTVEPIIKTEEEIETKLAVISPNSHKAMDYEFVEVKQEEELMIENYEETCNDPADVDEDQDETYYEKFDNPGSSSRHRSTNSQMEEESSKEEDDSPPNIKPQHMNYECKRCFEKFPDFKTLKKHRDEIKHPRNNYNISCPVCNKMIGKRWMHRHIETHSLEKLYSCEVCGASFSQGSSLSRHKRVRHSNEPMYQCPTCGKSFKGIHLLKAHQKREREANKIQIRNFQCTVCNRSFTTKRLLQQHSIIHGEKKFWCNVCDTGFVSKGLLHSHSMVHMAVRPYSCDVCGKGFSKLGHLETHKLLHTGEKPHVCSVCSKAFTHPTTLKYHMRIHSGEKPYTCEICNKAFTQPTHFKYHMRIHTGEKPYACEVCGKTFVMNYHLTRHKETHTGETLT